MAETSGLLNRRKGQTVPRVRITPSPPVVSFIGPMPRPEFGPYFDCSTTRRNSNRAKIQTVDSRLRLRIALANFREYNAFMLIEEYLKITAPKIGPNAALSLVRDARIKALESLLIEKGIATQAEIDAECEKQLGETAKTISEMPPFPGQTGHDTSSKKANAN